MSAPSVVLCVSLASCAAVGARAPVFNFQSVFMCLCTGLVRGWGGGGGERLAEVRLCAFVGAAGVGAWPRV